MTLPSGGSSVRRPGSEDAHQSERKLGFCQAQPKKVVLGFPNFGYDFGFGGDVTLQTGAPKKCMLVSMGGQAEGLACADLGARTPIGASRN